MRDPSGARLSQHSGETLTKSHSSPIAEKERLRGLSYLIRKNEAKKNKQSKRSASRQREEAKAERILGSVTTVADGTLEFLFSLLFFCFSRSFLSGVLRRGVQRRRRRVFG